MIHIVDPQLSQWDVGRSVTISGSNATHIHFANQGDSKAVIIEITGGSAKIPDYLLQTGKTLIAYAVLDGVTLESKSFAVRKRERPENYVYEDDRRNYIYELIINAENAVAGANEATGHANDAANSANLASAKATAAAASASGASDSANLAAKNANEAAVKAANTAKNLMVVGAAEGTSISLDDAINQFLVGLRVFGKTTQDGTPTPDNPVELVSVGDSGSITVNVTGEKDAQSMTIATPNGLPGIPVTSGGNYTDANGQQWICDEIDLARGVYVQRLEFVTITEKHLVTGVNNTYAASGGALCYTGIKTQKNDNAVMVMCDRCNAVPKTQQNANEFRCYSENGIVYMRFPMGSEKTLDEAHAAFIGSVLLIVLETPIETPLSEDELSAYASLYTYRNNTTVSNDAGAWMELEYVMDAKKYIDRLIGTGGGGGSSARLSNVTLLASAWKGTASPYSQVVTIDGITEYSKVDLLPGVEQLAIFHNKDLAFVTENEDGVVTVYAIGDKPTQDYTMQVSITEVVA